jgi:hypothetical protein
MRLFVLNAVEEFISNVIFLAVTDRVEEKDLKDGSQRSESVSRDVITGGPVSRCSETALIGSDVTKAVNFSYVRDSAILGPSYRHVYSMEAETEADKGKFMGFLSYLQNRQKVRTHQCFNGTIDDMLSYTIYLVCNYSFGECGGSSERSAVCISPGGGRVRVSPALLCEVTAESSSRRECSDSSKFKPDSIIAYPSEAETDCSSREQ